jgi:hypothetical protein
MAAAFLAGRQWRSMAVAFLARAPPAAPPQSRIELVHVLSLDELPRLGFLPLIFCNKLKMTRRRLDNSFFARMKGVPEFVGPHGTEG